MGREAALLVVAAVAGVAPVARAQATGMPSFNAPYRAFQRSELGAVFSFPDGGGTGFEGEYRYAGGTRDVGLRGGLFDPPGSGKAVLLAGAEARERVITHTIDFPLDGALVFGAGAGLVSGGSTVIVPVGLSLGRRIDPQGSTVSIVPYVQPTVGFVAGSGRASGLEVASFLQRVLYEARGDTVWLGGIRHGSRCLPVARDAGVEQSQGGHRRDVLWRLRRARRQLGRRQHLRRAGGARHRYHHADRRRRVVEARCLE